MSKRHIAIVRGYGKFGGPGAYTISEWANYCIWMYLIGEINSIELEMHLDEIKWDMPGAGDPSAWVETDKYFENLARQAA